MSQTAVPASVFTANGLTTPAETAILAGRQADYSAAFGTILNTDLRTPQGQLASSEAAIIGDCNDQLLALVNGVDPAFSSGRLQDGIGRIYYLDRNPAVATVVTCTCTGAQGTIIPAGATAIDAAGNIYTAVSGGTIPVSGSLTLQFANIQTGPIPCAANTLNRIYQTIGGWDAVNNPADGVLGSNVESASAFEARRRLSTAVNANGTISAIRGAVLSVPGVIDAFVTDNATNGNATINGVALGPNNLYVAVAGGADADVARAIWSKKQPGSPYYTGSGTTTVTVADNRSTYATPPTYQVSFQRAAPLTIYFQVAIRNSAFVPSTVQSQVAAAIISAMAGGDGGPRATIGSIVYASRHYAPVAALGPWAQIISIQVSTDGSTWSNSVQATMAQIPTVAAGNVIVSVQ